MAGPSPLSVLFFYPNLIGYARIIAVLSSYYLADTNWKASLPVRRGVGHGDGPLLHGRVADGAVEAVWGGDPGLFVSSPHVHRPLQPLDARAEAADTLADRNVITRLFYGCYPFFAFCCVGTELFYVALYLLVFVPKASFELGAGMVVSLHAVCFYVFLPACLCKQAVNVAQLCAASLSLASAESEAADGGAATSKTK